MKGLTPVRTARLIASLFALMGMVFLLLERVLSAVLVMAADGVKLGLARYNNFTGRFASQNFAEDKKLLALLKEVQSVIPSAETALTVLMVVAIVLFVIAVLGLALPKQFAHVLVALKLLKWETGEAAAEEPGESLREILAKVGNIPLKKIAVPLGVVLAIVIAFFAVSSCHEKVKAASVADSIEEMQQKALLYMDAQKAYFARNKVIGNASALQMADSLSTSSFEYTISGGRFTAVSKVPFENCPAGTKWSVSASTKGFFEKELVLYRSAPKDSACARLTPDFKKLGR
jgi:hypothetical protein